MKRKIILTLAISLGCCLSPVTTMAINRHSVTLYQAEQIALQRSPELKSLYAKSEALDQAAVAAGQLADPKLLVGALNVPVQTFNFSQEPMTQVQVGLEQDFPRGHSLRYRSLEKQAMSQAEYEKSQLMRREILRDVRMSWVTLYYWLHARQIVYAQKKVFRHLVKVTQSMLANNQAQQKDVIRAQLELTELDNRLIDIHQHIEMTRFELARWTGIPLALHANPIYLPRWRNPSTLAILQNTLKHHPELRTDQALIDANHALVKFADQQYRPGLHMAVAYGFRQGRNIEDTRRSDFLTAAISMNLPFFTHNRQDRTLKASVANLVASEENQMSHYRQLNESLKTQYITWRQQQKSAHLYQKYLIPESKQYAEATMTAYQNNQTDFPTLARAYVRELNTQLAGLQAELNREKARVNLFYLAGK